MSSYKTIVFVGQKGRTQWPSRSYIHNASPIGDAQMKAMISKFQGKMTRRMKVFLEESQKMDTKVQELLAKATEIGVAVQKLDMSATELADYNNSRKRAKSLHFTVTAKRGIHELYGALNITPASMKLILNSEVLQHHSRRGFPLPLISITYYRTIAVRDNYLTALVGGGSDAKEIPF